MKEKLNNEKKFLKKKGLDRQITNIVPAKVVSIHSHYIA